MEFRKELAKQFVQNIMDEEMNVHTVDCDRQMRSRCVHGKVTLQPFCDWTNGRMEKNSKSGTNKNFVVLRDAKRRQGSFVSALWEFIGVVTASISTSLNHSNTLIIETESVGLKFYLCLHPHFSLF